MPKDNPLIENSVNTFHYMFDCQRHCPLTQAANLWYDFSNPPRRSMQTISAVSSMSYNRKLWMACMKRAAYPSSVNSLVELR